MNESIMKSETINIQSEGIYVFKDENENCLFMFKKLTQAQMDVALPDQKGKECKSNYFIGIFRNGIDYLGKTEYHGIVNIMADNKMYNLCDSYTSICKDLKNFSESEYNKYKEFAENHMKTFYKIEELV